MKEKRINHVNRGYICSTPNCKEPARCKGLCKACYEKKQRRIREGTTCEE